MTRPLTDRERAVLDALLSVDFDGVDELREQASSVVVSGGCGCGCPSIDFQHPATPPGMQVQTSASIAGTNDGLFVFTEGTWLGGIEYMPIDEPMPDELPDPSRLDVRAG
jgi:hypothetical protein